MFRVTGKGQTSYGRTKDGTQEASVPPMVPDHSGLVTSASPSCVDIQRPCEMASHPATAPCGLTVDTLISLCSLLQDLMRF